MTPSPLIPFYRGQRPDNRGRFLSDVQHQSLEDLEDVHDYIQWMFPLPEPSSANAEAPILTRQDIEEFARDEGLREELLKSFEIMLAFYGLQLRRVDDRILIVTAPSFCARSEVWLTPHNHNFLRMTRILRSLNTLGCRPYARALFEALQDLYARHSSIIGSETFRYWQQALQAAAR